MDKSSTYYSFVQSPDWVNLLDDRELIAKCAVDEFSQKITAQGKDFCYLSKNVVRTSDDSNDYYTCQIYTLNTSNVLQAALIYEVSLAENESLQFHRIAVIRDGTVIDKLSSAVIRVLDDESASYQGIINKLKKVNVILDDLRLGDIFVTEVTRIRDVSTYEVSKNFFFHTAVLPSGQYWAYRTYEWTLLQNRSKAVIVCPRYFRDQEGLVLPDSSQIVEKDKTYFYKKNNFEAIEFYNDNRFTPGFELATVATWRDIAQYMSPYYEYKETTIDFLQYVPAVSEGGERNKEQTIQAYIEYIQNHIQYIYDKDEMKDFIPQSIEKTLTSKVGDCKAKSYLLMHMLNSIGIHAEVIAVNARTFINLKDVLPSPYVFNHVMLRVMYEGEWYFVDPTWSNRRGFLQYREEPVLSCYLPLTPTGDIVEVTETRAKDIYTLEETSNIAIKNLDSTAEIISIYRRGSADYFRQAIITSGMQALLDDRCTYIKQCLLKGSIAIQEIFLEPEITIISDDYEKNELVTKFTTKLITPIVYNMGSPVFRWYWAINSDYLINFKHEDMQAWHQTSTASTHILNITSCFYYDAKDSLLDNCEVDNDYFYFCNKKDKKMRSITLTTKYIPKKTSFVASDMLPIVKEGYQRIADNNYGIGITQRTLLEMFTKTQKGRNILLIMAISAILVLGFIYMRNL